MWSLKREDNVGRQRERRLGADKDGGVRGRDPDAVKCQCVRKQMPTCQACTHTAHQHLLRLANKKNMTPDAPEDRTDMG